MNKKFSFFVCVLSLLMVAVNVSAKRVLPSEAQNRAAAFNLQIRDAKLRYQSSKTQSGTISATPVLAYTAQQGDEVHFYVFNYADGGWAMIGGDDVCREVMAYSYTGAFKYENCPKNLKMWLQGYEKEISSSIAYVAEQEALGVKVPRTVARTASKGSKIDAMIETHWNQNAPYWNMCPKQSGSTCYTGCVATAMAQVMYYHKWPVTGVGSKTYTDSEGCGQTLSTKFYEHTYDYANMKLETSDFTTAASKNAVAQLMYDCGVSVEMMYTNEGSGAYSSDIPSALYTYFDYKTTAKYVEKSSYSTDNWAQMIYDELAAGRPVLYAGCDGVGSDAGGHQFVCDGYEYKSSADYFHFNWGWGGEDDGFFTLTTVGNTGYQFKYYQDAVIGITPNEQIIYTVTLDDDSTKLAPTVAGGSVTLPTRVMEGYSFCGWSTVDILEKTTTKPSTLLTGTYTPKKNIKLYPVYSYTETTGGGAAKTLISEDFASVKNGDNTTTGGSGTAWSGNTNFPTVSNVNQAGGAIRVGTSKAKGSMTTSALDVKAGQTVTVTFDVKGWTTVEGNVKVELGTLSNAVTYSNTMSDGFETKTVSLVATAASPTLTLSSTNKRLFLDNIVVKVGGSGEVVYYFTHHSIPEDPEKANVYVTDLNDEDTEVKLTAGDSFSLSDNIKSIEITESIADVNLTYTRNFDSKMVNNWQAWYMPCDFDYEDLSTHFDVAEVAGVLFDQSGENYVAFRKMTEGTVKAHTPYVIRAKATGDAVVTATTTLQPTNVNKTHSIQSSYNNFTFGGVYENSYLSAEQPTYALNKSGNFALMKESVVLRPFRIYMRITDREDNPYAAVTTPSEVKVVVLGEDETSIENVDADVDADGEIYNLAGQKLQKLQKGINIVNGKKILF